MSNISEALGDYSEGDSFEERKRKVEQMLKNPEFIELGNQTMIIDSTLDGQLFYRQDEILGMRTLLDDAQKDGLSLQEDDLRNDIAVGLSGATADFKMAGNYRIHKFRTLIN